MLLLQLFGARVSALCEQAAWARGTCADTACVTIDRPFWLVLPVDAI